MQTRRIRQDELFTSGPLCDLIPEDHILKQVERIIDLTWFHDAVRQCYCQDNGRPSVDPEAALRLMLAGFFQGITSDRRLMREAQVNVAIRWFAGYTLTDTLPDASSFTRIRQRWGRRCSARSLSAALNSAWRPGWSMPIRCISMRP